MAAETAEYVAEGELMWRRILRGDGSEEVAQLLMKHWPFCATDDEARNLATQLATWNSEHPPDPECYLIAPGWEKWCTVQAERAA